MYLLSLYISLFPYVSTKIISPISLYLFLSPLSLSNIPPHYQTLSPFLPSLPLSIYITFNPIPLNISLSLPPNLYFSPTLPHPLSPPLSLYPSLHPSLYISVSLKNISYKHMITHFLYPPLSFSPLSSPLYLSPSFPLSLHDYPPPDAGSLSLRRDVSATLIF
jgi:hypothetical protein